MIIKSRLPKDQEMRRITRFALWPIRINTSELVWLEKYQSTQTFIEVREGGYWRTIERKRIVDTGFGPPVTIPNKNRN